MIRGGGYYVDSYRKDPDGAWRIAATQYERIYEAMTSLDDTPSFKLIANRWDPVAQALVHGQPIESRARRPYDRP